MKNCIGEMDSLLLKKTVEKYIPIASGNAIIIPCIYVLLESASASLDKKYTNNNEIATNRKRVAVLKIFLKISDWSDGSVILKSTLLSKIPFNPLTI
jgi:hypothetical protein